MTAQDLAAIVKGIAPAVHQHVAAVVAPLHLEIASLKAQLANVRDGRDGLPGEKGDAGKDATPITEAQIFEAVSQYLTANPPEKGEKGDAGLNGKDGSDGLNGKDGIGLAGAMLLKDGTLAVTLSSGTIHTLGRVVGSDGEKGTDGLPGAPGTNGVDGKDGTLENILPVLNERTLSFVFKADGSPVPDWMLKLPMLIDRGVWTREKVYEVGDVLSYGGSAWIAKADSQGQQPGTDAGADFWRLAVKRGNDGKPGTKGLDGKDGKPGPPGRDGTRSY